jgi:hypothetical protein
MGVVYEAEQLSLRRRVALKVLPFAATMDPRQLQRFKNEALAAASLEHPHIVPVHGVGCERGVHYFAMKFIEGRTLAALIDELRAGTSGRASAEPTAAYGGKPGPDFHRETLAQAPATTEPMPRDPAYFRRVAEWGLQAAEALEHAHSLGIVHRDIKPANLMTDAGGKLWVTDFGLARTAADNGLTMSGDLLGTLRYMSPEQALARHGLVDHRSDVYALGVTLYELLTLRPAVEGKDRQEILQQLAVAEPPAPRRCSRAIPPDLQTIVLKAMAKEPAERYATARDLAEDLRRFQKDQPIRARPAGAVRWLRRWARRHPAALAAVTAAVLVTVAVLAGSIGWAAHERATRRQATAQAVTAALRESASWQVQRRLPEALSAVRRVAGLGAWRDLDEDLRRRVGSRLADLTLVERLDDARLEATSGVKDDGFDFPLADRLYREAFREAGLDVEALSTEEAGARLRETTVAAELAAAMDDWVRVCKVVYGPADGRWKHLLQVARAADPDPWRVRVRLALEEWGGPALAELAASEAIFDLLPSTLHVVGLALDQKQAPEKRWRFCARRSDGTPRISGPMPTWPRCWPFPDHLGTRRKSASARRRWPCARRAPVPTSTSAPLLRTMAA